MKKHFVWILTGLMISGLLGFSLFSLAKEGEWTKKADMPTVRFYCSASVVDGKIYVIGGAGANLAILSTVEEYDAAKDKWTKKSDMPTPRVLDTGATAAVDGKIYAIGGCQNDDIARTTVECYDAATDTWTKKADMLTPRIHFSTAAVKGKIYAIGGVRNQGGGWIGVTTTEEYDTVLDKWTKKADIPFAPEVNFQGFSASAVNDSIYVIGGFTKQAPGVVAPVSDVLEYDAATDTWLKKSKMPTPRAHLAATAVNGKIYAIGGRACSFVFCAEVFSTVEAYNPLTDTWTKEPDMPTARNGLCAATVNGKIYAIGGATPAGGTSLVEEYTPEGWPSSVSPHGKLPATWGKIKAK